MTIDLDALEGLAKAAVKGEDWSSRPVERLEDAEFIAAASPAVVARLISAARERDAEIERAVELVSRRLTAERDALKEALEEIVCWFGEAPHTFPDWKTCAEALSQMAENALEGRPALAVPVARQALNTGDQS